MESSVVSGEDVESEDEEFDRATALLTLSSTSMTTKSHSQVQVVAGEASESDIDEFGSSGSLESKGESESSVRFGIGSLLSTAAQRLGQIESPAVRKQRERNKSLRAGVADKFLKPVITAATRRLDRLSQNLSASQLQIQELVFQARGTTGCLLKLQKGLEGLVADDYLAELAN